MNPHTTIRFHGEGVEVDITTGKPILRLMDIARILHVSSVTILVSGSLHSVEVVSGLFLTRALGADISDVKNMVNSADTPWVLKKMFNEWLDEKQSELIAMCNKYKGFRLKEECNAPDGHVTIREFLAYNNVEVTDSTSQRFGIRASKAMDREGLMRLKRKVFVERETGSTTYVERLEGVYPYQLLLTVFRDLIS